jgi:glycosyltransferase involved in cell wall biosynthesis
MRRWLDEEAASGRVNVIHNHSLWMMPNVYPGRVCRRHPECRLVVSPRGTLSQWALRKNAALKKMFWLLLQGPAVSEASCFHATARSEYEDIRRCGINQPVCILPNGIDVLPLHQLDHNGRLRLLFLSRIHPKKGLDVLMHAWHAVEARFPDWDLDIVGPGEPVYMKNMRNLATALRLKRVSFRGPIYGDDKLEMYRAASIFVLPTHSENFGVAVAEALAAGTPAIVTVGAPWSGLISERAGWWIEQGVDALVACLEEALATSPERLAEMGAAGRRWMIRDFSWQQIGERFSQTYHWLLTGRERPSWVTLD